MFELDHAAMFEKPMPDDPSTTPLAAPAVPGLPPLIANFTVAAIEYQRGGSIRVTLDNQSDATVPEAQRFTPHSHASDGSLVVTIIAAAVPRFQLNQKFAVTLTPQA